MRYEFPTFFSKFVPYLEKKQLVVSTHVKKTMHTENTFNVNLTFEYLIENMDILYYLAHIIGNPLQLLIGILPKLSKRCGASAQNVLAMRVVDVDMKPFFQNVTNKAVTAVIHGCPNLTTLNLSHCNRITYVTVYKALKTNSALQTLNPVSYTHLTLPTTPYV